ncbi:uncharacterized protein B0T15DRAFT_428227 [Chaetomium strumarium]|uniref:Zn(2)-C6 fungal-type domain-containing protein n=1 Tax=Chaetomium strumarium TaxID=1170767 RepID=A0AAJ0M3L3_9PEZI|nr:hypothetical protein B0T15DRAFT_428227 [Chaetomium strumarium]
MADQTDSDTTPQRKRIAVACGRCRKRKIRCSGDPGHGQPCSNCKNAGVDQCQFLRVSSREAHLRDGASDFGYSVGDARVYASRTPVGGGMPYNQDLPPTLGSSDVLGSYRGAGSAYAFTPTAAATTARAYYPAMHAYGTPYADDFELGLGVSSPSVMSHDQTGMLPGQWSSGAAAARQTRTPTFSSMYMDPSTPDGGAYGGYGGTPGGLLHRTSADSPNFSFSAVAASLPLSSTPGPDRVLPNPTGQSSSTLPYPGMKPPTPAASSASAVAAAASTLADVATAAASYAGGFETTATAAAAYAASSASSSSSSSATASGSSMSGTSPSVASRSNSDSYSDFTITTGESHDRGHQSSAYEYTSPRRGSSSQVYGESAHEVGYDHHHHHQHHGHGGHPHQHQHPHQSGFSYMSDPAAAHPHAHGQVDDRHVVAQAAVNAVAGRH